MTHLNPPPPRSDRFKEEIATDETKLSELNERRNEKLARVKVVQKEKDGLEAGKREAEDYLRQENDVGLQSTGWTAGVNGPTFYVSSLHLIVRHSPFCPLPLC